MKPRVRSLNEDLAAAMREVVKKRLAVSGMQEIWRDDHSWRTMADELIMALAGKVALVDRETYGRIFANSEQFKLIRKYIEDYQSMRPKDQKKDSAGRQNAIAKWAAENMNGEKKETT